LSNDISSRQVEGRLAVKRRYDDGCGMAHALELVGERWALLVVRELLLGPRRFSDLRASLPGISPNVLTERLAELGAAGILRHCRLPPPISTAAYDLTDWGRELEPVIRDIGRWAARSPRKPPGLPMSVNSIVLSFRTMFSAEAARGFAARLAIVLAGQAFRAEVSAAGFRIAPGEAEAPDARLQGDPNAVAAVVYGGVPLDQALREGLLTATGDLDALRRFVTLFPLPPLAPMPAPAAKPRRRRATALRGED
jgi:DNA-binding HxlR family transcriptional regulator